MLKYVYSLFIVSSNKGNASNNCFQSINSHNIRIKQEHGGQATEKASKKNKSKSSWSYKSTKSNPNSNVVLESSQAEKSIKSQKASESLNAKSKLPKATKSPGPEDWSFNIIPWPYESPKNDTKSPKATKSPKSKSSSLSSTSSKNDTKSPKATKSPKSKSSSLSSTSSKEVPTPSSESDVTSNPNASPTQQDKDTIIPFTNAPPATPSAIETCIVTSSLLDDAEQTTVQFNYEISVNKLTIDDNEEVNKILDNLEAAIISHLSQVSGCKADRNLREAKRRHLQLMKMEFLDSRNIAGKL